MKRRNASSIVSADAIQITEIEPSTRSSMRIGTAIPDVRGLISRSCVA